MANVPNKNGILAFELEQDPTFTKVDSILVKL